MPIELKKTKFAGLLYGDPKRTWSRAVTSPIYSDTMQTVGYAAGSIYWPWVVPMYKYLTNPLAKYYMYYSTDHDNGQGGIFLALSDSPLGPFVQYTGAPLTANYPLPGAIYQDTQGGSTRDSASGITNFHQMQVETPTVVWDATASLFRMFYQAGGGLGGLPVWSPDGSLRAATGVQGTLSATSPDGLTWTKDQTWSLQFNKATGAAGNDQPGDGHTGYFATSEIDGTLVAYSLYGSGDWPKFAMHLCQGDTKSWITDPAALGYWPHLLPQDQLRLLSWNHCFVHKTEDGPKLVGVATNFTSGSTPKDVVLVSMPLDASLRRPLAAATTIWSPSLAWEDANVRSIAIMRDGPDLYLYYLCKTTAGAQNVGVMKYDY